MGEEGSQLIILENFIFKVVDMSQGKGNNFVSICIINEG